MVGVLSAQNAGYAASEVLIRTFGVLFVLLHEDAATLSFHMFTAMNDTRSMHRHRVMSMFSFVAEVTAPM